LVPHDIMQILMRLFTWAEIHQALSQFSLLVEVFIVKVTVKDYDKRVLTLVNLNLVTIQQPIFVMQLSQIIKFGYRLKCSK
jgi:hypothetical protein